MPLVIDGVRYFSAIEVAGAAGVSRVTLWRWRQRGKIPLGHRFRGRQWVFTQSEVDTIREFALRIEPLTGSEPDQLSLFRNLKR